MGLVYLAGPMAGLSYTEARYGWREWVSKDLWDDWGIYTVSPMRLKNDLRDVKQLSGYGYNASLTDNQRALTARDRNDVMRCDLLLANFLGAKTISKGTLIELGWADAMRKPVVIAMESSENLHDHAMVREIAAWIVPSLADAVEVIGGVLSNGI